MLWLSLVAFGEQADTLTSHRTGDVIIVSGGMRSAKRRGNNGKIIRGYQVSADIIEHTARQRRRKRQRRHRG